MRWKTFENQKTLESYLWEKNEEMKPGLISILTFIRNSETFNLHASSWWLNVLKSNWPLSRFFSRMNRYRARSGTFIFLTWSLFVVISDQM